MIQFVKRISHDLAFRGTTGATFQQQKILDECGLSVTDFLMSEMSLKSFCYNRGWIISQVQTRRGWQWRVDGRRDQFEVW